MLNNFWQDVFNPQDDDIQPSANFTAVEGEALAVDQNHIKSISDGVAACLFGGAIGIYLHRKDQIEPFTENLDTYSLAEDFEDKASFVFEYTDRFKNGKCSGLFSSKIKDVLNSSAFSKITKASGSKDTLSQLFNVVKFDVLERRQKQKEHKEAAKKN